MAKGITKRNVRKRLVLACIGIPLLAAGGVALYRARQYGRQKATVVAIRQIAGALEAYAADHRGFPTFEGKACDLPFQSTFPPRAWPVSKDISWLRHHLEPKYIGHLPLVDGWEHSLLVEVQGCHYTIVSKGRDGRWDREFRQVWPQHEFDSDFVYADGIFLSFFEGMAKG